MRCPNSLPLILPLLLVSLGCGRSGPPSIDTTSEQVATLPEKIKQVETYVRFRRKYEKLDYRLMYKNNSGGFVPAPSEWDVRLVAIVPGEQLQDWSEGLESVDSAEQDWLKEVPTKIDYSGVSKWFRKGGVTVGIDEERRVVVYRNQAY